MDISKILLAGLQLSLIPLCSSCSLSDRVERLEERTIEFKDQMARQEESYERQLSAARTKFQLETNRLRLTMKDQSQALTEAWTKFNSAYSPAIRAELQTNIQSSIESKLEIDRLEKVSVTLLKEIAQNEELSNKLRQTVASHEEEARRDNQIVVLRQTVTGLELLSKRMAALSNQMSLDLANSRASAQSSMEAARISLSNSETARINSQSALEHSQEAQKEAESARLYSAQVEGFTQRMNGLRQDERRLRRDLGAMRQDYDERLNAMDHSLGRKSPINHNKSVWEWIDHFESRLKRAQAQKSQLQSINERLAVLKKRVNTFHSSQRP
ncbi:MAG: hypothetical protein P1V97_14650 [Planctomycetota bacterium]|nr:hypothetical protein [Planctomycetota bacterium]